MNIRKRGLFLSKVLYFLLYAAIAIFIPFANIYYKNIGLTGVQIGWLITTGPLVGAIVTPIWGLLVDRLGRLRIVLTIAVTGSIIFVLLISTVKDFLAILILSAIFNIFVNAIMPLVDNYTLTMLGSDRQQYGAIRVWGTIGFLVISLVSGSILGLTGLKGIFWGYAAMLLLTIPAIVKLPSIQTHLGQAVFRGFSQMMRQKVWIILAVCVVLVMIANISWINFLSLAMKSINASDTLIGMVWSIGALSELPAMLFGQRLLRKWGSRALVGLGFFFYGLRMLLFSSISQPEWALAINILHGLCFGIYWIGAVNYVNEIAPEGLRATSQSLLSTFFNVASVTGGPFVGLLYDQVGPFTLFRITALLCWAAVAIFLLSNRGASKIMQPA